MRPVCCIYHKPHPVGESSSESSSDDDSSESEPDSEPDRGGAVRRTAGAKDSAGSGKQGKHAEGCAHATERGKKGGKRSGNAYEKTKTKAPKAKAKGGGVVVGTQVEK